MAKKKRSSKQRKAIAAAVEAANSATIPERELAHIRKVLATQAEADAAWQSYKGLRSNAKAMKEQAELLYDQVHAMLRFGPEQPALFDKHDDGDAKPQAAGPSLLWSATTATERSEAKSDGGGSWEAEPIATLRPPKGKKDRNLTKAINSLAAVDVLTLGQFEALRAKSHNGAWFEGVPGLGREAADAIENAVIDWLTKHRDAAQFASQALDRKEHAENSAELAASLVDWRRQVAEWLLGDGDMAPDCSATKLRKFLRSTKTVDEARGLEFYCDGSGIHVAKSHGQLLAAGSTISYPEAVKLLQAVAAESAEATAEAPAESKAAPGELPADWQRFIVSKLQAKAQYFELPTAKELKDDHCPGGRAEPGPDGFGMIWLEDGIHVNCVRGVECSQVIPWADAARLMKQIIQETKGGPAAA